MTDTATIAADGALRAHIQRLVYAGDQFAAYDGCQTTDTADAWVSDRARWVDRRHDALKIALTPVPAERALAEEILRELARARTEFPGKNVTFAALVEEVGELATATFEESRNRVRTEAVQVAVMAMRIVLDGDHTFDDWRASKGLDPLVDPSPDELHNRSEDAGQYVNFREPGEFGDGATMAVIPQTSGDK